MTKTPEQIQDDKLASNVRKSKARSEKAHQAVIDAMAAPNANANAGKKVIRQRHRAAQKAGSSKSRHECILLKHETDKTLAKRFAPAHLGKRIRI